MPVCPICESAGGREFFEKDGRVLLICRHCRHIWWEQRPSETELNEYYRSRYTASHAQDRIQEEARAYYRRHVKELAAAVGGRMQDLTLLDYGCSIPVLGHEAAKLSFKSVVGVDWADYAKEQGREWGVTVMTPPEFASLRDLSVDIVRFSHVIEHSIDPLDLLRSVLPKVRAGGLIYITQPNFPVFLPVSSEHDLADTVYPEHLHFFSALSLVEMVNRLNLCVTRFFSHQNEAAVISKYSGLLDLDYARERLAAYADRGDPYFPAHANFPYYAGENSVLYARMRK